MSVYTHPHTVTMSRRSFVTAGMLSALTVAGCAASTSGAGSAASGAAASSAGRGSSADAASALAIDPAAWSYDAEGDVYYQLGVAYCTAPVASEYESMGIYVPGAYFTAQDNGDGTYTCAVNAQGAKGEYTAASAPVVLPVNTAGYSAQAAPTEYSSRGLSDYLDAGLVYVYAGCRGRSNGTNPDGSSFAGGAPWGVTDLKAAIRCLRLNAASLPGDMERIFAFGHSGGGAQSALVGATGDAPAYEPYLASIGAAFTDAKGNALSDAICGAMCWCPITSLDVADEAYEWMMGQFSTSGTRAEGVWTSALSRDLAKEFVSYINSMALHDANGSELSLTEGGEGIYLSGSYYEHLRATIEGSLNDFLKATEFPYTTGGGTMADGGFAGGGGGEGRPSDAGSGDMPSGGPSGGPSGSDGMPSGGPSGAPAGSDGMAAGGPAGGRGSAAESQTFETASDYIASLNASEQWVSYDAATNTASITSVGAFVRACKQPTKDVGAFDALDRSAAENYLFGTGEQDALHFDAVMASLLEKHASDYAAYDGFDASYAEQYAADLKSVDALGSASSVRQNLYNPLYFISDRFEGFGHATPAPHWRIRTGIEQGDTSLTTEMNLALALAARPDVADVDFATIWGQGHTTAELTGSSIENFLAWIKGCA